MEHEQYYLGIALGLVTGAIIMLGSIIIYSMW